jgi:hypothetical protein
MKLPSLAALKNLKLSGAVGRTPGFVCVNVWPDRVDVSHVVAGGKARPEIKRCDTFRKVGGEAATLTRLRRELHLDRYRCATPLKSGTSGHPGRGPQRAAER